jgi:hypothetical protein
VKRSAPPRLAIWLLDRLADPYRREAMAGDLIEECRQGRSAAWCWRQVLRALWVRVRAAVVRHPEPLLLLPWWVLLAGATYKWGWPIFILALDLGFYWFCARQRQKRAARRVEGQTRRDV